jgi:hypothetical protein
MTLGPNEIHHLILRLKPIRDALAEDKTEIMSIYSSIDPKHDARITAYSKAINVITSVQLALLFMSKHLFKKKWWETIASNPIPDEDKLIYTHEFGMFTKIGFVQGIYMVIESSLRLFLRALDPDACNRGMEGFESIYNCLFKSKLRIIPTDGVHLIDLLRFVRNTIHNNGVYFHPSGNDNSVKWNGETFEFKQGAPVDFVTWDFLTMVSDELRKLLREVVEDSNLRGISVEINDPFS